MRIDEHVIQQLQFNMVTSKRACSTPIPRYPASYMLSRQRIVSRDNTSGGAAHDPSGHYMPQQTLFDRDRAVFLVTEADDSFSEEAMLSFYGASRSKELPTLSPINSVTPNRSRDKENSSSVDLVTLLQEQQAMLQKILREQIAMKEQQQDILDKQKERFFGLELNAYITKTLVSHHRTILNCYKGLPGAFERFQR